MQVMHKRIDTVTSSATASLCEAACNVTVRSHTLQMMFSIVLKESILYGQYSNTVEHGSEGVQYTVVIFHGFIFRSIF